MFDATSLEIRRTPTMVDATSIKFDEQILCLIFSCIDAASDSGLSAVRLLMLHNRPLTYQISQSLLHPGSVSD